MSNFLSSPYSHDKNFIEGMVTYVDPIRFICTVKTIQGQYFSQVPWLLPTGGSGKNGMHLSPSIGDQVVISTVLTYPIIIGSLPRIGVPTTSLTSVSGQPIGADAGNNSSMRGDFVANPEKPNDFSPGDFTFTSEGGGILSLMANGSGLFKASGFAQIFLSKFNDLVRVVARNWERFSDIGQQTVANIQGRMYDFLGWDRDLTRSKVGIYELNDIVGDVALGEAFMGEPNEHTALPDKDDRLRKYWLEDTLGHELMVDVLQDLGKLTVTVQDIPKTTKTVTQHDKDLFDVKSESPGNFSKITITPTSLILNHKDLGTVTLDDAGIRSTFGGHFVNIDSSGVHLG